MEKGIDKSAQRALEAYPIEMYKEVGWRCVDKNADKRKYFIEGYHQAEKDLELTWKDMECIIKHYQDIMSEKSRVFVRVEDYQELLKRFKDFKERKEK